MSVLRSSGAVASLRLATRSTSPLVTPLLRAQPALAPSLPRVASAWRTAGPSSWSTNRSFHSSSPPAHGGKGRPKPGEGIKLTFKKSSGEILETVEANEGDDIVDVSWEYDLDIEAACEKSIACSTCHIILEPDLYDTLEEPSDDENDMLDLAFGLTDTSRLGCQVKVTKAMHGTTITLPSATRNLRVDGSKPTPH